VVRQAAKKLIVPTVHPVGPIERAYTPNGFSLVYKDAFLGVGQINARPLPKSKYIASQYAAMSPVYVPSTMNNSAYVQWMSKLSRPRGKRMTSPEYARALEILNIEFSPFVVGGLSTLDEVLKDIDWDKSPGWPYVNEGCSTKRDAWEQQSEIITERALKMTLGEYVECIFIASLKDELLPPGKSARVFLPAPFHHQIACAILFKKATDSLTRTCHLHSSAIGVNIFGMGLERCLRSLEVHPFAYDADQSGCDTSWKDPEPERDFMKNGLPHTHWPGVDMVFNTAMCPRVIVGDRILQVEMNPSGWYLTTVVNTLMTHRTVASAYLDLSPEGDDIMTMRQHLKQVNGGDDLAYSTDREWFGITQLAHYVASRGMYLETNFTEPRNAMTLTFFSHNLYPRLVESRNVYVYVACGRLSKVLSAFSYLKISDGEINWLRNASRVVGLMINLWPYRAEYNILHPYLYHLVHELFLRSGRNLTPEWSGVFRSIPSDNFMLALRNGHSLESGLLFSRTPDLSSFGQVKRVLQSALKSSLLSTQDTNITNKNMSRAVDSILDNVQEKHGLSDDGRNWLIAAMDPFHDSDMRLAGYPDISTGATVVQLVKQQLQITVPSTVTANSNWDAHLCLMPTCNPGTTNALNTLTAGLANTVTGVTGELGFGAFQALGGPAGSVLFPGPGSGGVITTKVLGTLTPSTFVRGNSRVIGCAFEVVNTTAEIYKQGQVTTYRLPTQPVITTFITTGGSNTPSTVSIGSLFRSPPSSVAACNLLMGTRTWAAAEGAYVVGRQNRLDNPLAMPAYNNVWHTPNDVVPAAATNVSIFSNLGTAAPSAVADTIFPYDISGAYFTGLSYNSTLTVTCRWLVERLPGPQEPDLAVLASPAACYDSLALEIYARAMNSAPPGVMLKENPLGEWFRSVLKGVANWAPKVGSALSTIGVPFASSIGNAVGGGASFVGSRLQKAADKKKTKDQVVERPKLLGSASELSRRQSRPASSGRQLTFNKKRLMNKKGQLLLTNK